MPGLQIPCQVKVEKVDVPHVTVLLESRVSYSPPANTQMEKHIQEEKKNTDSRVRTNFKY